MDNKFDLIAGYLIILSILSMSGCSHKDNLQDLHDYINQLKQSQSKPKTLSKQDIANIKFPAATTYQASTLRDPFLATNSAAALKGVGPLQSVPLSMLRFVGTMTESGVTTGYILTPDNMVYEVKLGDKIGEHYGKIIEITPTEIKIIEQEFDNGQPNDHTVIMQLKDEGK